MQQQMLFKFFLEVYRRKLNEEAPVNNVGDGNVAGVGVGPNGEPGLKRRQQMIRRRRLWADGARYGQKK